MVDTVTSATFTTLTAPGAGSFSAVGICLLLALIVCKELVATDHQRRGLRLSKGLAITITPLLCMFLLIVAMRLYSLFR